MDIPRIDLEQISRTADTFHYRFSSTADFFRRKEFMIRFEGGGSDMPESILAVPFAALMAPIAMAAGAELRMPALDREFAGSLAACQSTWRRFFPKWSHDRYRLETKLVANDTAARGDSILFSCGLDSLSTYLHNRQLKPHLLCIFGADIPLSNAQFIAECRSRFFDAFAKTEGVGISYIHTDIREAVDLTKLQKFSANWYSSVQFGLLYAGLTAPATYGRFERVILASCSHGSGDTAPCAADPGIVRGLRWGSTRIEDQLRDVSRVQKIARYLKPNPSVLRYLRVCWEQFEKPNCSRCKKCLRTICELLVNGIDPNLANFQIDARTLPELRKKMTNYYHLFIGCDPAAVHFWRDIQEAVPPEGVEDRYGAKEFFAWLADYEPLKKDRHTLVKGLFWHAERMKKRVAGFAHTGPQ